MTPRSPLAIGLITVVVPLALVLSAASVLAAPQTRQYVLPGSAVFPEGIAFEESTGDFFVSSTTDGTIFRADVADETAHEFLAGGGDGRTTAIGVAVDGSGRLFIAGGGTGTAWVYDSTSGDLLGRFTTPAGATFLNDIAIDRSGDAYVTDSLRPIIWRITAATITADLTALESDDQRRDGQLARQGIQTSQFPTATFKLTAPIDLGSVPADGKEMQVTATGQLTLHGETKDVQIPLKARLSGSTIAISGSLPIVFADYGIQKPNSFMVLSIADEGTMELQLFFTKAA